MSTTPEIDSSSQGALRQAFLQGIAANGANLQSESLLRDVAQRLRTSGVHVPDVAILTAFNDLLRTGYLGWGMNLSNSKPPWLHVTALGRSALEKMSRDPFNADGYMAYLSREASLDPVAESYIREAVSAFNAACFRATAVMVGAAAEQLVLGMRNALSQSLTARGSKIPKGLDSWMVKPVLDSIDAHIQANKASMDRKLFDEFDAHWHSFSGQIRLARNSAGHPSGIEPIDAATSHASLLIFPELARLSARVQTWMRA